MFKRSFSSKDRAGKSVKSTKKTYRENKKIKLQEALDSPSARRFVFPPTALFEAQQAIRQPYFANNESIITCCSSIPSPIVTLVVGFENRLFAAHEDVLSMSPFFSAALGDQILDDGTKKITLSDEEPEILSCVLEFLYKGDYYPRLLHDKRRNSWQLEGAQDTLKTGGRGSSESTIFHSGVGDVLLRDTVIYCAAEKYGLDDLKRLALRKQGLQAGIPVDVILRSARYTYDNTPDSESRLRAHFLALIIRSRKTFKRSGTMQLEMEKGGKLFFDLFVAMCNHIDDVVEIRYVP
ncbi:hypothetical protein FQN57_003704 [Myotisia sp. PD_48]|nr:hypothetical protein FQN57_003704 [Myotisia sp. PD_48]